MKKPVQISIPTPCHENWQDMKPVEKGRFCDSCQKKVHDFTASPDKVILEAFAKDSRLCGRFRVDQLDRELILPIEKSTLWIAASVVVLSLLSAGSNVISAQERVITGTVSDDTGPVPGVLIIIKGTSWETQTDVEGNFSLPVGHKEILIVSYPGFETKEIETTESTDYDVTLDYDYSESTLMGDVYVVRKSFFGRIFHSIGNLFR